ncbi:MAG: hypothetical protein QW803_12175 [Candidatus Methanomethylicia archaeon]
MSKQISKRMLYILCDDELYRAFRRYASDYRSYAEALRELLIKAGVLRRPPTF